MFCYSVAHTKVKCNANLELNFCSEDVSNRRSFSGAAKDASDMARCSLNCTKKAESSIS